jgi:hypothetical protein
MLLAGSSLPGVLAAMRQLSTSVGKIVRACLPAAIFQAVRADISSSSSSELNGAAAVDINVD